MEEKNPEIDSLLQQLKSFAQQQKDDLLLNHIEYLIKRTSIFREKDTHTKIERMKKLQAACEKNKDLLNTGDCLVAIGQIQFVNEQYARAFENLLAAETIFKQIGYENVPNMGKYLHDFALDYFFFQDYERALAYMNESIKLPKYNNNLDVQQYNTLGVSYLKLNWLDSAYIYLDIAYKKAVKYKNQIWIGLTAGSIGEVLFRKGEYQKALYYFSEDYRINKDSYSADIQQNAFVNMAKIHLKLGDLAKASHYLALTSGIFPKPETNTFGTQQQLEQAKRNYYEVCRSYYLTINDYKTALQYADSLYTIEKILDSKYNALVAGKAEDQLKLLQSKMELQIHEKEQGKKNIIIISLIVITVLGAGISFSISKYKKKISLQKQLLLRSQLEIAEQNLKLSELKLDGFKKRIQEKRHLIETMQEQLASLSNINNDIIFQLQQSTILTDEDWQNFKILFEKVHSGFLKQLIEKYPKLSQAEIRFLSLAKLNFSRKEMAAALGVSSQSIHTNWYRIRKKLDLPESWTVDELIETV